MDKHKAREFLAELNKLQEKFGIHIESSYEEEIDYTYEEEAYVSGVQSYLILVDKQGNEINVDAIQDEFFTCGYCGEHVDGTKEFCNQECEQSYKDLEGGIEV